MATNTILFVVIVLIIVWVVYRSIMGRPRANRTGRTYQGDGAASASGDSGSSSYAGPDGGVYAVPGSPQHHHGGGGGHDHAVGPSHGGDGGGHSGGVDGGGGHGGEDGGGGSGGGDGGGGGGGHG